MLGNFKARSFQVNFLFQPFTEKNQGYRLHCHKREIEGEVEADHSPIPLEVMPSYWGRRGSPAQLLRKYGRK